jgi:hypothetical protein
MLGKRATVAYLELATSNSATKKSNLFTHQAFASQSSEKPLGNFRPQANRPQKEKKSSRLRENSKEVRGSTEPGFANIGIADEDYQFTCILTYFALFGARQHPDPMIIIKTSNDIVYCAPDNPSQLIIVKPCVELAINNRPSIMLAI